MLYNAQLGKIEVIYLQGGGEQLRKFISTGGQGRKCGGVGGTQRYVSVGLQMSAVSLKIYVIEIDATFTVERQNIFDLIAQNPFPADNFIKYKTKQTPKIIL